MVYRQRAYVGPDGAAAEPHPDNVPYRPTKFLRACPEGVSESDFVFLLGFPGHTMRYAPSSRLAYADEVAVPSMVAEFGRKLGHIAANSTDRAAALKMLSAKKSLANEHKRSAGKRVMMKRLGLLAERQAEEAALIAAAPEAEPLLARLGEIYDTFRGTALRSDALQALQGVYHGSVLLAAGHFINEARVELAKPDADREDAYRERNRKYLVQRLTKRLGDMHVGNERALIGDAKTAAAAAGFDQVVGMLEAPSEGSGPLESLIDQSTETPPEPPTREEVDKLLGSVAPEADRFVGVADALYEAHVAAREEQKALLSERDVLLAKLLELQKQAASEDTPFFPDANSTLRLSAGHVEGYKAADAVQHTPITTLQGLIEKHEDAVLTRAEGPGEFECPERLVETARADVAVRAVPTNVLCKRSRSLFAF